MSPSIQGQLIIGPVITGCSIAIAQSQEHQRRYPWHLDAVVNRRETLLALGSDVSFKV
jgi:hypothetical protein